MRAMAMLGDAFRIGLAAARANLVPGLVIQGVAILVVILWYQAGAAAQMMRMLSDLKEQAPWWFAALSTGLMGGVVPGLVRWWGFGERQAKQELLWWWLFWSLKGLEVNALYVVQDHIFGGELTWLVIISKTLADQLIYALLWAVPSTLLFAAWLQGEPIRQLVRDPLWYQQRVLPTIMSNWALWLPAVALIYMLPLALQLPIQNLVLCLWSLLIVVLARKQTPAPSSSPSGL